jgi:hypothetical protein
VTYDGTFLAFSTCVEVTGGTSMVLDIPGSGAGDGGYTGSLYTMAICVNNRNTVFSAPPGWTLKGTARGASHTAVGIYERTSTSTEGTYTFSWDISGDAMGMCALQYYSGAKGYRLVESDPVFATASVTAATSIDFPDVDPSFYSPSQDVGYLYFLCCGTQSITNGTMPTSVFGACEHSNLSSPGIKGLSNGADAPTGTDHQNLGSATSLFSGDWVVVGMAATVDNCPAGADVFPGNNIACGATSLFNNRGATAETGEPTDLNGDPANGIWFTFTPPTTATYTISTQDSSFDTILSVYTGSAVNSLTFVADDDDSGGSATSLITMSLTGGTPYRIRVSGYGGVGGGEEGCARIWVAGHEATAVTVIASHADTDETETTGSHTFDLVPGITAGEILVLFWTGSGWSPTGSGYAPTVPTGYTTLGGAAGGGPLGSGINCGGRVWAKVATGSEGSTITIARTGSQASIEALVSVRVQPPHEYNGFAQNDTIDPPAPRVNGGTGDTKFHEALVLVCAHTNDAAPDTTLTAPSGYTMLEQIRTTARSTGTATKAAIAVAYADSGLFAGTLQFNPPPFTSGDPTHDGQVSGTYLFANDALCPGGATLSGNGFWS